MQRLQSNRTQVPAPRFHATLIHPAEVAGQPGLPWCEAADQRGDTSEMPEPDQFPQVGFSQ